MAALNPAAPAIKKRASDAQAAAAKKAKKPKKAAEICKAKKAFYRSMVADC